MYFSKILAFALMGAVVAAQESRTVHVVYVGSEDSEKALTFRPNKIVAEEGDLVQFQFLAGNHTITQSTFDQPCMPMHMFTNGTGIYSGFQPVAESIAEGKLPTYTVKLTDAKPMWFYCSQGRHCQSGMAMVVNENTAANSTRSLETYVSLAASAAANLPGDAEAIPSEEDSPTGEGDGSPSEGDAAEGAPEGAPADPRPGSSSTRIVPGIFAALAAATAALLF